MAAESGLPSMEQDGDEQLPRKFDRYDLLKKLATGGMAEIWLARQTGVAGFNRFIVIKKILSHLAEEETFKNMFVDGTANEVNAQVQRLKQGQRFFLQQPLAAWCI